jgi:hypothetical protein
MGNSFRILAFGLLLTGVASFSQASLPGSIRGVVCDPGGAAMPGVTVTVTDDAGKLQQTAITDESGLYSFSAPPGRYTLLLKPPQPFQEERISAVAVNSTLVTNQVTHLKIDPRVPNFTEPSADAPEISPAVRVLVPSDVKEKRHPSFSLRIHMANDKKTPTGAEIKLSITMRNISRSQIFFNAAPGVPQLSGFLPDVRDARGRPVPLTYRGKKYFYASYITVSDILFPVEPGKTVTQEMELDKLFDLSHPGEYKVHVVRSDTQAKTVVKSNILKLKLARRSGAAHTKTAAPGSSCRFLSTKERAIEALLRQTLDRCKRCKSGDLNLGCFCP